MVPVAGRPLIDWVIERLRAGGAESLIVVRHASDDALAAHLRERWPDARIAVQDAAARHRRRAAPGAAAARRRAGAISPVRATACSPPPTSRADRRGRPSRRRRGRRARHGRGGDRGRSAVQVDGDRVVAIVEKPAPGTAASSLVATPLYWLPRAVDRHLAADAAQGAERYVSVALAAYLRAGGVVRALRLRERLEVTTAADVEAVAARLRSG